MLEDAAQMIGGAIDEPVFHEDVRLGEDALDLRIVVGLFDQIREVPRHVVLVIAEKDLDSVDAYKRISAFASWCSEIGISRVTVYINMLRLDPVALAGL